MSVIDPNTGIKIPRIPRFQKFTDAGKAVDRLCELYESAVGFLCGEFTSALHDGAPRQRIRAFYPEIRVTTSSFAQIDSRLSFGHLTEPGTYATTVSRPGLFRNYLEQQLNLLMTNHEVPVGIGVSDTPMPVHFAVANDAAITVPQEGAADFTLRDYFDVPDLTTVNDDIVNGTFSSGPHGVGALAPCAAQRVD